MKEFIRKIENVFVILALFWGVIFIFANPPFMGTDEDAHFYKMYNYTEGVVNFTKFKKKDNTYAGGILPYSLYQIVQVNKHVQFNLNEKMKYSDIAVMNSFALNKELKAFVPFAVPTYSVLSYFPGVIVLFIMKIFNTKPLVMFYILRFCTLFTYLAMIYWSIKITPVKKWIFTVSAMLPISVFMASLVNTDAILTGYCYLFTAYMFNLAYNPTVKNITKKQFAISAILLSCVSICKFPYLFLGLLYFIIPKEKFENFKNKNLIINLILLFQLLIALICVIWNHIVSQGIFSFAGFLSPDIMLKTLLTNPSEYVNNLINAMISYGGVCLDGAVALFGWMEVRIFFGYVYLLLLGLLINGILTSNGENYDPIKKKDRIIFWTITVLFIFVTTIICYLLFSSETSETIRTLNGRYLIPLWPLILSSISTNKNIKFDVVKLLYLIVLCWIFFVSVITILTRFYGVLYVAS